MTHEEELNKIAERIYPNKEGDLSSLHAELQRGGFIRGFQYCLEQMLKEAVEVDTSMAEYNDADFKSYLWNILMMMDAINGDKVKLIIIKED